MPDLEATPVPTPGPTPAFTRTPVCLVCPTPTTAPTAVPTLSEWALIALVAALAFVGWWRTRP